MGLSDDKKLLVKETIKQGIRYKLQSFHSNKIYMPFHNLLLGKDIMALFSFIHSLNTTFNYSIYEPVAVLLASGRFKVAKYRKQPHNQISKTALHMIQNILDELTVAKRTPDREAEFAQINAVSRISPIVKIRPSLVDIWLEDSNENKYLIKIKSIKPSFVGLMELKHRLLKWVAQEFYINPDAKIYTLIGIPYNPKHPKPYEKWWMSGLFDTKVDVLVGNELWDFIGGDGAYLDLLDCFEQAGIELQPEINKYFAKFIN